MYRSLRFWFVLFIAVAHISFFADLPDWWYNSRTFTRKVELARANFQRGVVLPLFALEEDYNYREAIDEIRNLGASSVSIFLTSYQEDIRSNSIYLNLRASEPLQLEAIIDYAHRRGLSVFLFPTLHIQHLGYKEWRGVLQPQDPEQWWDSYFRVIRYYLHVAAEHHVEMFSIGSELGRMEQDGRHWSEIINYCRKHYSGLLAYSANWDHYSNIVFMKDLDYLGLSTYFGLTRKDNPTLEEVRHAWDQPKKRIEEAYREYHKPMLLTEIGYPSVNGGNRDPWNYFATGKVDVEEQALCYQAFIDTWDPPPAFLHGVFFYNWWGPGGLNDRDYTPRGKPAARLLEAWYRSF
ncbi:MAG TPA: hypothetical protein VJ521_09185 [Acidobacteriota bacterium]|nr:hypothetical protein [Acidobacteriota bacterium]